MSKRKSDLIEVDGPNKERDQNKQRHDDINSGEDFEDPFEDEFLEESGSFGDGEEGDEENDGEEGGEGNEEEDNEDPEIEQDQEVLIQFFFI